MNGRRSVQQERAHNLPVMIFGGPAVCTWSPDNWAAKVGSNYTPLVPATEPLPAGDLKLQNVLAVTDGSCRVGQPPASRPFRRLSPVPRPPRSRRERRASNRASCKPREWTARGSFVGGPTLSLDLLPPKPLPLQVHPPLAPLVVPYTRCSGLHACSLYVLMKHDEGGNPYLRNCLRTEALPQDHPWPERGAD